MKKEQIADRANPVDEFKALPLACLRPNPYNPRKRFSGPDFDRLLNSIRKDGILQPPLVRPVPAAGQIDHEVVFGGRRFKAACMIAEQNGGLAKNTIIVRIRELDDEAALDLMTIENLQRDDLTPMEEAEGFKIYVDKRGEGAIDDLAERTNISAQYIRRRLNILTLPKAMLTAWDKGHLKFSHVEQLARVKDKEWRQELFTEAVKYHRSPRELHREIQSESPALSTARFDTSECAGCRHNTDMQKKLFDFDSPDIRCLNRACFVRKQQSHFDANWKNNGHRKKHKTHHPLVLTSWGKPKYEGIYFAKAPEKCAKCESFVTVYDTDGDLRREMACIGDQACFKTIKDPGRARPAKGKEATPPPDPTNPDTAPRVGWHGPEFADRFFKDQIPLRLTPVLPDAAAEISFYSDTLLDRLAIACLLDQCLENDVHIAAARRAGIVVDESEVEALRGFFRVPGARLVDALARMDQLNLRELLAEILAAIIVSKSTRMHQRRRLAAMIGIDLATEYAMPDEYLQKKTKAELLAIGKGLGIFDDDKAKTFLFEKLLKKRGKFDTCKKPELVRVFLESGVELKGKVPAEIIGRTEG